MLLARSSPRREWPLAARKPGTAPAKLFKPDRRGLLYKPTSVNTTYGADFIPKVPVLSLMRAMQFFMQMHCGLQRLPAHLAFFLIV